jgi:hypothetical protein
MPTNPATCRFGTRPSAAVTVFAATITMTMPSLIVAICPTSLAQTAPKLPFSWSRLWTRLDRV